MQNASLAMQTVCSELVESEAMEQQIRWDKEATTSVIGMPWRLTDGRWTAERLGVCVDPIPIPPLPYAGARVQRGRISKQDNDEFGAIVGCLGCNAIKDNKRAQALSRSLQCSNRRMIQGLSARSRKVGSKK